MSNFWFWAARPIGEFLGVLGILVLIALLFVAFVLALAIKHVFMRVFFGRGK